MRKVLWAQLEGRSQASRSVLDVVIDNVIVNGGAMVATTMGCPKPIHHG
jgi:hypothetical protein